ncbi:hypothetical protein FSP39_004853 [Pinctada imbricata]|uniref:RRM domain-containing protein n=1 Tax=Pinctada imbricata TaxID=66713 RepID=A0AA89BU33_PINIB|nr:hypothetical protein FSP39_004853 [Pinctada imbricata]
MISLQGSDIPSINVTDFETEPAGLKYASSNIDLWKNINAMLYNTLDFSTLGGVGIIPSDQAKQPIHQQMPIQTHQDHMTAYDQLYGSAYSSTAAYPGFQLFSVPGATQHHQTHSAAAAHQLSQQHLSQPHSYQQQIQQQQVRQQQQQQQQSYGYSQQYRQHDLYSTPPQKQSRAIKGSPSDSSASDYGTMSPQSPSHENNLSPVEKLIYSSLVSGNRQTRSSSPCDSDTSGISSEGSDTALLDMMNSLSIGNRKSQTSAQSQFSAQSQDVASQIYAAQQQQYSKDQTSALSTALGQVIPQTRTNYVINPFLMANTDPYAIDRAAKLHRNAAAMCEASCTWSGQLPPKNYKNPTYSCKVFLGGVPWDITEAGLQTAFNKFGVFKIEWPGKDGYVYLLFESEKAVHNLLQDCTHDFSSGDYYYKISSRRMRAKEVIPWVLSDSNYVRQPSQRLDSSKTVFVGALHGMMTAESLANIMNDLFGNVVYAGIDTDKHKYPIGMSIFISLIYIFYWLDCGKKGGKSVIPSVCINSLV